MRKRKLLLLGLVLLLIVSMLSGCGQKETEAPTTDENSQSEGSNSGDSSVPFPKKPVRLAMGSGTSGGTFYIYSGGVASIINSKVPNVEILVEATSGSPANITLLQTGELDISVAEAGPAYERLHGINLKDGETKFPNLRALTPMYVAHFGAWTLDKNATNITEIAGKTVATGPYASGADVFSKNIYKALGINADIQNMGWGDCFSELGDGRLYAVTGGTGHPSPAIVELETKKEVNHIRLTDEQINKITEMFEYYSVETLPGNTYKYLKEDYKTVGVWACIFTTGELDENIAYHITKAIMENNDTLVATHPTGAQSLPENIVKEPIPLHKGALKYYQEIGIDIPEKLIPDEAK